MPTNLVQKRLRSEGKSAFTFITLHYTECSERYVPENVGHFYQTKHHHVQEKAQMWEPQNWPEKSKNHAEESTCRQNLWTESFED